MCCYLTIENKKTSFTTLILNSIQCINLYISLLENSIVSYKQRASFLYIYY